MLSAIVLAAGLSKRMGSGNKMLLPFKGKTVIAVTVENILAAGMDEVIAVTGFEHEKIQTALQGLPVRLIHNPYFEKGMTSSVQQGVAYAAGDGYMICLGDMTQITPDEYTLLKNKFEETHASNKACICMPFYKGEKGNPVIFSSQYRDAILQHTDMEGCKGIVQENKRQVSRIEMPTNHVLMDMDYPEDYKSLINA